MRKTALMLVLYHGSLTWNPTELTVKPVAHYTLEKWLAGTPKLKVDGRWFFFTVGWFSYGSMLIFPGVKLRKLAQHFSSWQPRYISRPLPKKVLVDTLFLQKVLRCLKRIFFLVSAGLKENPHNKHLFCILVFTHWYQMCWNANWLTPNMIAIGVASEHI